MTDTIEVLKAEHTPGPWETDGISVRSAGFSGRMIALCEISVRGRPYDETYDEAIANATLIASAPDMLEELKSVRRERDNAVQVERQRCAEIARNIIIDWEGERLANLIAEQILASPEVSV
jgi:hypothetical protein